MYSKNINGPYIQKTENIINTPTWLIQVFWSPHQLGAIGMDPRILQLDL